jgi:uroporphyrinogen-III decarboxylase
MLELAVNASKVSGNPRIFMPIHKGIDGFMSEEQFKKFFWPTLRDLIAALVSRGLTPCILWEGNCTSRLEIIKDIPPGKVMYGFEATDIFKAKQVIGGIACIRGNVPMSLLATGTPDDVKTYCKKLIDIVGNDGGYIMDSGAGFDDAKPENVRAMFEFTKEYGVYR